MYFQPEINPHLNSITGIDGTSIKINQLSYTSSVLLSPIGEVQTIHANSTASITEDIWQNIIAQSPEVLIIGTGTYQQFLTPALLAPLYQAKIGIECMSSNAAARTYNVLMSEGRQVLALILLPNN